MWSGVELDESLLGVLLCTASSSCLSGTGEEAEGALCLVGGGGAERKGEGNCADSSRDGDGKENITVGHSIHRLPP